MKDILNDINHLEKILWKVRNVNPLNSKSQDLLVDAVGLLDKIIAEKNLSVSQFEKTAPKDIQHLCKQIRGEL